MKSVSQKIQALKSDRGFLIIFTIHLLLAFFHLVYSFRTDHWQCYVRAGFCFFIAASIFIFGRKGFSVSILLYAYTLLYFNNFYNYTSFVFLVFAILATPKLTVPALIAYAANLIPALVYRQNEIPTIGIHALNCTWVVAFIKFVVLKKTVKTLNLTDDERLVLSELSEGKLQKQIEAFSQNTVTKLLKSAQERNHCRTKQELLNRYILEHVKPFATESQGHEIESQV